MKVDLLIRNCMIAACDAAFTEIDEAALAVERGKITWLGDLSAMPEIDAEETIDAKGRLLAPGLVNCHCHLADSLFRGLVEDLPLEKWLSRLWQAESAILNPETTALGARLGLAELLLGGTTSVLDMFWFPDATAKVACEMGVRIHTGGFAFDPPGADGLAAKDRLSSAKKFIENWKGEKLVTPVVMAHGAYTVGPHNLQEMHGLSREEDLLFHIHAAETRQENQTVEKDHGSRVLSHLNSLGALGPKTLLAHAVHLDDDEIDLLAKTKAMVVHNPVSNLKLGSGFARVPEMVNNGTLVALGTDGAVSGNDIDMFLAIRLGAILHRGSDMDPTAISARQAVSMATLQAAKALGADNAIGSLEVGKNADMMLLDLDVPHAMPLFDCYNHLAYSASKSDVATVWVDGKKVVDEGVLLTIDTGRMIGKVRKLAPKIKSSLQ